MKNKKITILLLAVVIAIWGTVFFKFFSSMQDEDKFPTSSNKNITVEIDSIYKAKEFSLIGNYRDPFLGKTIINETKNALSKMPRHVVKVPDTPPEEINWSFIKYVGIIKNSKFEKKISLISINEREYLIAEGQTIENVKCLKNYKDSILISYQGRVKGIKR